MYFYFVTGTVGIVDYTNYDDMKYAVRPYGIAWPFHSTAFSCSLPFDLLQYLTWDYFSICHF
jgi:hypothetical protein